MLPILETHPQCILFFQQDPQLQELDYRREASNCEMFAALYGVSVLDCSLPGCAAVKPQDGKIWVWGILNEILKPFKQWMI